MSPLPTSSVASRPPGATFPRPSLLLLATAVALTGSASAAEEKISFNEHIRPILSDNCFACHGTDAAHRKAKLRLDTPEGAYAERNDTRAVVPGKPEDSELWHRINSTDEDEVMPSPDSHKKPLTLAQRDLIKRWIEQGAVYQKHWAYEPLARAEIPKSEIQSTPSSSKNWPPTS